MTSHPFTLFADYHQFYLQDESAEGDLSMAWTEEAERRRLAVAPGAVGIGTARAMDVPVTLEIHTQAPPPAPAAFELVVECALQVDSGRIVVAGCTDYFPDAARVAVAPGSYRVRACHAGLDTVSADELDGDDRYLVQLWPAPPIEPTVVRSQAR